MKVQVLMATYNGEKYIRAQLDSILNQDGVEVQILVRDDGSQDNTLNILREYATKGALEWYKGEHLTVAQGYLELIQRANSSADYYAFSDQDDVWDNDKLAIACHQLNYQSQTVPSLYFCGQTLVDSNLAELSIHRLNDKRNLTSRFIYSGNAGCTTVFNRRLAKLVNEYSPSYSMMHDSWLLKVCLCTGGTVIADPDTHMKYRQHGNNTVGLGVGLKAQIQQLKQYLSTFNVEQQMSCLWEGYSNQMLPEFAEITNRIRGYRRNLSDRLWLLSLRNISFGDWKFNLVYLLAVLTNNL